jgi:hypothetical protein
LFCDHVAVADGMFCSRTREGAVKVMNVPE